MKRRLVCLVVAPALFALGCGLSRGAVGEYSPTIDLKVDTLGLMSRADEPYAEHAEEVEALLLRLYKAAEYDRWYVGRELYRMWEVLLDPREASVVGYFELWSELGTLEPAFIDDALHGEEGIAVHFDRILVAQFQ